MRRGKNKSICLRLAELECLRVLQEERPLLGEEERKPGQVHLLLVRLHLSEVGVDRQVERQSWTHAPFRINAGRTGPVDLRWHSSRRSRSRDRTG